MARKALTILLAAPRGFCAGVDRAIQIVERALLRWGPPVYVRHEIVHNKYVVDKLSKMGAVFVEELDECPVDRPVIFSAHGVPKSVPEDAKSRNMIFVDATCPLVSKVHVEAAHHHSAGREILLIGHAGHPEVIGTMGQLPEGQVKLIQTPEDAENLTPNSPDNLAYVTQTTLSIDDTKGIVTILERRFPNISKPHKEDICYATTNRQEAVKALSRTADLLLVIGSQTSSNSLRLKEVGQREGVPISQLIDDAGQIDWAWFDNVKVLALTAGASAPESLVFEVLQACRARFDVSLQEVEVKREDIVFKLPKILTGANNT
ncbi:MAG: 4-hydroxy-3-methylbut-2-enyl diphosphate reductase [Hyphomonadaceae bacterium]|nr:MAG: 4-hydroxy-3-methylbut-2-enyl diphosphate reductase [Hyphomonadaceae bacterium]